MLRQIGKHRALQRLRPCGQRHGHPGLQGGHVDGVAASTEFQEGGRPLDQGGRGEVLLGGAGNLGAGDDLDGLGQRRQLLCPQFLALLELVRLGLTIRPHVREEFLVGGFRGLGLLEVAALARELGLALTLLGRLPAPCLFSIPDIIGEALHHQLEGVTAIHLLLLQGLLLILELEPHLLEGLNDAGRLELISVRFRRAGFLAPLGDLEQRLLHHLAELLELPPRKAGGRRRTNRALQQLRGVRGGLLDICRPRLQDPHRPLDRIDGLLVRAQGLHVIGALLFADVGRMRLLNRPAVQVPIQCFDVQAQAIDVALGLGDRVLQNHDALLRLPDGGDLGLLSVPAELAEG
mmetsp:Transcript_95427/g.187337  ORF Transcript_95427/g.187337 Transcript_95427/m.187337 type:complete len:349 (+) Transcript_95427:943-1989(+)